MKQFHINFRKPTTYDLIPATDIMIMMKLPYLGVAYRLFKIRMVSKLKGKKKRSAYS